ncbi:MAG TPA: hypothetical protein VMA83_02955 [Solirubrobacteraceae bacterium]|nr:hypothetical protein [Solirubrobacteraceae bacterium]
MDAQEGFDLAAAGLRGDGAELLTAVEILASKLEQALPTQTRVQRSGGGLLGRGAKRVSEVRVELATATYLLDVKNGRVEGFRQREVGGISIKREALGPDEWIAALTNDLGTEAERSSQARSALDDLLR